MEMKLKNLGFAGSAFALLSAVTIGATATWTPVGPTTVPPGTNVVFDLHVTVGTLTGFDAADVIVGTSATDVAFSYSAQWLAAFANVTPPFFDVGGFYPQSVFVGGNHTASVGTSLLVGRVTVSTAGMSEGTYAVGVNAAVDGVSGLTRSGLREPLSGSASFTVQCPAADINCDGNLDLVDHAVLASCLGGPAISADSSCLLFDLNGDGDVDASDAAEFFNHFTGTR